MEIIAAINQIQTSTCHYQNEFILQFVLQKTQKELYFNKTIQRKKLPPIKSDWKTNEKIFRIV